MELIGTGVKRDELYYFGGMDFVYHLLVSSDDSLMDLWHRRWDTLLRKL